jgi:drug/metabolite transporter (DMT)-like permease
MPSISYWYFTGAAIVLWATLALLVSQLNHVPPFLLLAVALLVGGSLSLFQRRAWQFEWRTLLLGLGGIFGYHFLLIMALRLSSPVEANLINYLWPLLIVLLSPVFFSDFRLTMRHLLGGLLGFIGVFLLIASDSALSLDSQNGLGYLLALAAAFTWAVYSLLSKRMTGLSTATIGLFCLLSGALALACHFVFETHVSLVVNDWLFLLGLGLGPMGLAFYAWDAGLKRGDPRVIGTLSYLTPLLSTLLLLSFGDSLFEIHLLAALCLIVGGAFISSYRWPR